jgi:amino acid transporter
MGFWDVLLFNIATVLGPRWIAAAGHNGTSSISLWVLAAVFFFVPGALVINELSSRFPEEGGLYAWSREAFGPFHGFVAGWTYWIYTFFYFPGLLLASASMAAYIIGGRGSALAQDRTFQLTVSLAILLVAVVLNIVGLNIGKWLQNAGGVGTYVPCSCWLALRPFSVSGTAPQPTSPSQTCCPRGTGTRSTSGLRSHLPLRASNLSLP